jgi:hypothetical protein
MRTTLRFLAGALLLCSLPTRATVITVPNPGNNNDIQPNLQAAVNKAQNGDEVDIPAGQFVVNNNVLITKFVSIHGQGIAQTILYRSESASDQLLSNSSSWDGILNFNIGSNQSSNIQVTGICFKSKQPSITSTDGLSLACDIGIKMVQCVDFIISDCSFQYFGNAAIYVIHDDSIVGGLIQRNQFYHNAKGADALGEGYGVAIFGTNNKWIVNPRLGTSNFIFVENNTFDFHRHSIAAGGCALYVFRHNTVINNIAGGGDHAIDAHAARMTPGLNYYGTRAVEVYNDSVVNTTFQDGTPIIPGQSAQLLSNNAVLIKAGDAIIHDNYIRGYRFAVGIIDDNVSGTQAYPILSQPGYLSGLWYGQNHSGVTGLYGDGDLFTWNNSFTPYAGTYSSAVFYNFQPEYFVENRDYHLLAKPGYTTYTYPHPLSANVVNPSPAPNPTPTPTGGGGHHGGKHHGRDLFDYYPNPASAELHITQDAFTEGALVELVDLSGRVVYSTKMSVGSASLDISWLPEGAYFIRMTYNDTVQIQPLLVKRQD